MDWNLTSRACVPSEIEGTLAMAFELNERHLRGKTLNDVLPIETRRLLGYFLALVAFSNEGDQNVFVNMETSPYESSVVFWVYEDDENILNGIFERMQKIAKASRNRRNKDPWHHLETVAHLRHAMSVHCEMDHVPWGESSTIRSLFSPEFFSLGDRGARGTSWKRPEWIYRMSHVDSCIPENVLSRVVPSAQAARIDPASNAAVQYLSEKIPCDLTGKFLRTKGGIEATSKMVNIFGDSRARDRRTKLAVLSTAVRTYEPDSPKAKFLWEKTYREDLLHPRDRGGQDRFLLREANRARAFRDVYLIAKHNVCHMGLIFYASLEAYSFDLLEGRAAMNIILRTEDPGCGKSVLTSKMISEMRNRTESITYKSTKALAISGDQGEQCYNQWIMEEISENLLNEKGKDSEAARIFKHMLTGATMSAQVLSFNKDTGKRESSIERSYWIAVMLGSCNIPWLLSLKMDEPMQDRIIVISLDVGEEARREILEKKRQSDALAYDPDYREMREEWSELFKWEERVYAEYMIFARTRAVVAPSADVAGVVFDCVAKRVGRPARVRSREKAVALAKIIALLDAVARVVAEPGHLETSNAYERLREIEKRAWVTRAHAVYAIGMAPFLFVDTEAIVVRKILAKFGQGRTFRRAENSPNFIYAVYRLENRGLYDTVKKIHANLDGSIKISMDEILHQMQSWTKIKNDTRTWRKSDDGFDENAESPVERHPVAGFENTSVGTNYLVQLDWLKRIPPDDGGLDEALEKIFSRANQGGFAAPFGFTEGGSVSSRYFPETDGRPLQAENPTRPNETIVFEGLSLDDWGLARHNERIHLSKERCPPLSLPSEGNAHFCGKLLEDVRARAILGEGDEDWSETLDGLNSWENLSGIEDRGTYKVLSTHPKVENVWFDGRECKGKCVVLPEGSKRRRVVLEGGESARITGLL